MMLDMYGYIDGVATNVVTFKTGAHGERILFLPVINAELHSEKPTA